MTIETEQSELWLMSPAPRAWVARTAQGEPAGTYLSRTEAERAALGDSL
jgi:hypothetical protein